MESLNALALKLAANLPAVILIVIILLVVYGLFSTKGDLLMMFIYTLPIVVQLLGVTLMAYGIFKMGTGGPFLGAICIAMGFGLWRMSRWMTGTGGGGGGHH